MKPHMRDAQYVHFWAVAENVNFINSFIKKISLIYRSCLLLVALLVVSYDTKSLVMLSLTSS